MSELHFQERLDNLMTENIFRRDMLRRQGREFRKQADDFSEEALHVMLQTRMQGSLQAKEQQDEFVSLLQLKKLQTTLQKNLSNSLEHKAKENSRALYQDQQLSILDKVKYPGLRDALLYEQLLYDLDALFVFNKSRRHYKTESEWKANVQLIISEKLKTALLEKYNKTKISEHGHLYTYDTSRHVVRELPKIWPLMGHIDDLSGVEINKRTDKSKRMYLSVEVNVPRGQQNTVNMLLELHIAIDGTVSLLPCRCDPPLLVDKIESWRPITSRDTLLHLIQQDFRYYWFGSKELKEDRVVIQQAIALNACAVILLRRGLKTDMDFLKMFIAHNPEVIKHIDMGPRTDKQCMECIAVNPSAMIYFGKKVRKSVVCAAKAMNDIWARFYLPQREYQCHAPVSLEFERAYKPIANIVHQNIRVEVLNRITDTAFQHMLYKFWKILPHEYSWNDAWGPSLFSLIL
jgi:hypothetical protein